MRIPLNGDFVYMDIKFNYLINEIINVAPATVSDYYTKQKFAKNRLEILKKELVDKIEELEKKVKQCQTHT